MIMTMVMMVISPILFSSYIYICVYIDTYVLYAYIYIYMLCLSLSLVFYSQCLSFGLWLA